MDKPNKDNLVKFHHYQLHLGSHFICSHTCKVGIEHKNESFHDLVSQNHNLPDVDTSKTIVDEMLAELYAQDNSISNVRYAAIYHQLSMAKRKLDTLS